MRVFRTVFDVFPTEEHATRLHAAAGAVWDDINSEILAELQKEPSQYIGFLLRGLGDPARAWSEANRIGLSDRYLWPELVAANEKTEPAIVIPVIKQFIEAELRNAGVSHYRRAVKQLQRLRRFLVAEYITTWRNPSGKLLGSR